MGWLSSLLLIALQPGGALAASASAGRCCSWPPPPSFRRSGLCAAGPPDLPASPRRARISDRRQLPLTEARHAFFGTFHGRPSSWLAMSEALRARGKTEDAVGIRCNAAVRKYPGDPQLWVGLGNALVDHAHGLTPPAELAYRRAAELAPGHPAPRFLLRPGAGPFGRPRRPPSRCGGSCWRRRRQTQAGARWSSRRVAALRSRADRLRPRPARKAGPELRRRPRGGSCRPTH